MLKEKRENINSLNYSFYVDQYVLELICQFNDLCAYEKKKI
jgi:hypothetical protein